jgi:hypothetical protein
LKGLDPSSCHPRKNLLEKKEEITLSHPPPLFKDSSNPLSNREKITPLSTQKTTLGKTLNPKNISNPTLPLLLYLIFNL